MDQRQKKRKFVDQKSGYNPSWINASEKDLEDFICSICACVFREPVNADNGAYQIGHSGALFEGEEPCGHVFCEGCILQWLNERLNCPICKRPLRRDQIRPDMGLRRKVRELMAKCHIDPNRCDAKGKIGKDGQWWEEHENVCQVKEIQCPGCSNHICERRHLISHIQHTCPFSYIGCTYRCGNLVLRKDLKIHETTCTAKPFECPECKKMTQTNRFNIHLAKECEMGTVACDYQTVGCTFTYIRKDEDTINKHNTEMMALHNKYLLKEFKSLRARVDKRDGKENKDMENELDDEITFYWIVPLGTPTQDSASGVLAEAFGGKWGISYGHAEAKSDEIPVYIFCMDLQDPIKLNYSISLLNPFTAELIRETSSMHTFSSGQHCGQRSLVSLSELQEQGIFDRGNGMATLLVRARLSTSGKFRELSPCPRPTTNSLASGSSPLFYQPLAQTIPVPAPVPLPIPIEDCQEEAKRQQFQSQARESRNRLLQLHLVQMQAYQNMLRPQEYPGPQQLVFQQPMTYGHPSVMMSDPHPISAPLDLLNSGEREDPDTPSYVPADDDEDDEGTD